MLTPSRILITGLTGFVGRHLAEACLVRYPQATIFGLARHDILPWSTLKDIHIMTANIGFYQHVRRVIAQVRPDIIFHLAAQSSVSLSWNDPVGTLETNAHGLLHVLEAVLAEGLSPHILVVGSSDQYGFATDTPVPIREGDPFRPLSPFAVSKAAQDFYAYLYFFSYHLPVLRVRAFSHFGPYQTTSSLIADMAYHIALIEKGKREPVLTTGQLDIAKDILPVQDVVSAYIAIIEHGQPGSAYNVGSGRVYTIADIARMLLQCSKADIRVQEDLTLSSSLERPLAAADISLLNEHTGWQPSYDVNVALQQTLEYWRAVV